MKLIARTFLLSLLTISSQAKAADLLSVYHDATTNSPLLTADLDTALATGQAVAINVGNLLPQVATTASANLNRTTASGIDANYSSTNYGLTITQQVINYTDFANTTGAEYQKQAATATYNGQEQQFTLNVAEAYFNVITAEYDVELAQSQYDFLKKTLNQVEAKFSVGLATYTDVAQARANMKTAYATLVKSQNNLAIANQNLKVYTGVLETRLATINNINDLPIKSPIPANVDYWVKLAESKNPQLMAQEATENQALATVHANVGNQLPNLYIQASYQKYNYNNNVPLIVSPSNSYLSKSIELGVSWNIFSGGETMGQTLAAADQYVSQENTSTNLYRQTNSQTTQDYLSVLASIAQIRAYQQSVISALTSLKEFNAKYKVGTATIVEVLNEVQSLYQARYDLAQALNQYIDSSLSLKTDVGLLSVQDLAYYNQFLQVPADKPKSDLAS